MKKGLLIAAILVLVSLNTACVIRDASISPKEKLRGSENLITETRSLPDINSVNMTTAGNVNVTYGTEQEITVTVEDNIMEHIKTTVSGGELFIGTASNVQISNMHLTVNITMTDLEVLTTSSAGTIEGQNKFEADELYTNLSSAGSLFLRGSVNKHHAVLSSAGSLYAFDLMTDTTKITVSSAGNAQVYASQLLDATISSIGSVFYKGNPTITQRISSLGKLYDAN